MKRHIFLMTLLLVLMPFAVQAQEISDETMAHTIFERETADGSFNVMGDESTWENFSVDKIQINVLTSTWTNLYQSIFHRTDYKEIKTLLETYNRYYLSSLASGRLTLCPQACFVSEGLFQEANARSLYMMYKFPDAREGKDTGDLSFSIEKMMLKGNLAKVVIKRDVSLEGGNEVYVLEQQVREGYLLKRTDSTWRIENIIFDNASYFDGDPDKIFSDQLVVNAFAFFVDTKDPAVLQEAFSFENFRREDYSPYENYIDFVIGGDITRPAFDIQRFNEVRSNLSKINADWNSQEARQTKVAAYTEPPSDIVDAQE